MRNCFAVLLVLSLTLGLMACESSRGEPAGLKIGVADIARLMRDSVPGKAGLKFLENRQAAMQKELDDIQARLDKNPSDEAAIKDLQRIYAVSQQQIQAEGQNVAGMLFDTLQRVIDNFRQENGYDIILSQDTVASFNKKYDVTDQVMDQLDKQKIDFRPLPKPASVEIPEEDRTKQSPEMKEGGEKDENADKK